ncbi:RNA polymerase sigma factor [Flavivirga sp. 57AJ16]|uniref:RNA polymerase sigma factor n=1 Tax=Flavivirga sp. 57AJ16 TaxID=3025307 RepID=UPI0023661BF2|nr:sigma factor-like helix-turn-helix DNA-binding protein [Flavivirga sp. 57AJ16]MDD7886196.1 sigma factor-like helix-turn-helix DNA-binding protein [Flavivirga sp. 57AJ16]
MKVFLKSYPDLLLPYSISILGSYDDAMDVIQDVILAFIQKDRSLIINYKNYLIKSTINKSISFKQKFNRNRFQNIEEINTLVENGDSSDFNLIKKDNFIHSPLIAQLERINKVDRAIFILKYGFDYSHKEIANLIKIDEQNSRKILSRTTQKFVKINTISNSNITFNKDLLNKISKNEMLEIEFSLLEGAAL